jgi:hypothetical protein
MGFPSSDAESSVTSPIKTMVNGDTIFTFNGDIQLLNLYSECISPNDGTASTLQYQANPLVGAAATISGISASLASAIAGTVIVLDGGAFTTAPVISTTGVALAQTARGIILASGTLKLLVGVGSTTGTWRHYIRYRPLEAGAYVN